MNVSSLIFCQRNIKNKSAEYLLDRNKSCLFVFSSAEKNKHDLIFLMNVSGLIIC